MPAEWGSVDSWLSPTPCQWPKKTKITCEMVKKVPEIPPLDNYSKSAPDWFWEKFPKSDPEVLNRRKLNVKNLKKLIQKCWFDWTPAQRETAKRALRNADGGAHTKLKKSLGPLKAKNVRSAHKNGMWMTDVIASWVKKGFVAGPFTRAPLKNFRQNPMMAAEQRTKVRPIMNLSAPLGESFNEAVDTRDLCKLRMSSAKLFGDALLKMGKRAVMSKFDIQDAYKLIQNHPSQRRLFGFKWLGKFFLDSTLVFGSKAAPEKFDSLPETLVNITCQLTSFPKSWVFRQLDDVPTVAPEGSSLAKKFADSYKSVCERCGVPLAEVCPSKEKAFELSTQGTVLGIRFDSEHLTWSISSEKQAVLLERIRVFCESKTTTLNEVQKLHGKLSDFAQMMQFMLGFRFNLLALLKKFHGQDQVRKLIPDTVKLDLQIWAKCIQSVGTGFPISEMRIGPPLSCLFFVSDAAGAAYQWEGEKKTNISLSGDRGVASVGFNSAGVDFVAILRWPDHLLFSAKDWRGTDFGHKSSTLEMLGLILPFLGCPNRIRHRHVVLQVDNLAVVKAWERRLCRNDPETSCLIRALHILEGFLECVIHVAHCPRMSTPEATLADHLSRASTTTLKDRKEIEHLRVFSPKGSLTRWLKNPKPHWHLGQQIVQELIREL